jgi:uncharacterized lipoprotein YmbA
MNRLLTLLLPCALAACASAPSVHYWTLQIPYLTAPPAPTGHCALLLRPIDIPPEFDRENIVTTTASQQLAWRDDQRWERRCPACWKRAWRPPCAKPCPIAR